MKAIILSAGYGTRMRPLTYYVNKGMVPVKGLPLLEHIVTKLRDDGFHDIIIAVSHLHEQVEHYFGHGERFGVTISYSVSSEPLGTAGELWNLRDQLKDAASFLVHYGDIFTDIDLVGMKEAHCSEPRCATIGLVTGVPIHTGIATLDGDRITEFREKPPLQDPCHAAVHIYSTIALRYMRPGEDLATLTIPRMIEAGEVVCGFYDKQASWHDVGRLSDIEELNGGRC